MAMRIVLSGFEGGVFYDPLIVTLSSRDGGLALLDHRRR